MSAFLVEDKTINVIVSRLAYGRSLNAGWYQRQLSDEGYNLKDKQTGCKKLGEDMFRMNIAAVTDRYKGGAEDFRPLNYRFRYEESNKFQVLKSLQCFLYQCSEGDVPEKALYKILSEICASMAKEIVAAMPEYETASWG